MTFERVYTYIVDKCPQLAIKGTLCVHEWLSAGYDPELDIIPAIDFKLGQVPPRNVYSFNYFTPAIMFNHDKRIKEKAVKSQTSEPPCIDTIARNLAWKRSRGMFLNSQDEQILNKYEKDFGPISVEVAKQT